MRTSSRAADPWDRLGRKAEEPYFGWLTTELQVYSTTTLNLMTHVHTRPIGERPYLELEPTEHPLAVEQRTGITMEHLVARQGLAHRPLPRRGRGP